MKQFYIFIFACIINASSMIGFAQPHIDFTYDAAGNRVVRSYAPGRFMDSTANDPEAEQIASQFGINVYPNPLMDGSNVTVAVSSANAEVGEEATIFVLDNSGKVLLSQKQNTASPTPIDLSGYASGIYYIKVAIKKEQLFYRIVKAK